MSLYGGGASRHRVSGLRASTLCPQESGDENVQHPPCSPAPDHRPQGCMPGALGNQRTDMQSGDRRKGFTAPSLQVHSLACRVHGPALREQQAGHRHPHPAAAPLHGHGPCSPSPAWRSACRPHSGPPSPPLTIASALGTPWGSALIPDSRAALPTPPHPRCGGSQAQSCCTHGEPWAHRCISLHVPDKHIYFFPLFH